MHCYVIILYNATLCDTLHVLLLCNAFYNLLCNALYNLLLCKTSISLLCKTSNSLFLCNASHNVWLCNASHNDSFKEALITTDIDELNNHFVKVLTKTAEDHRETRDQNNNKLTKFKNAHDGNQRRGGICHQKQRPNC